MKTGVLSRKSGDTAASQAVAQMRRSVLAYMVRAGQPLPMSEIAAAVGISLPQARSRLEELRDVGDVELHDQRWHIVDGAMP